MSEVRGLFMGEQTCSSLRLTGLRGAGGGDCATSRVGADALLPVLIRAPDCDMDSHAWWGNFNENWLGFFPHLNRYPTSALMLAPRD